MKKFLITLFIIAFLVGGALLGAHIYRANKKNSNPVDVYGVSNWLGNYYDMEQSLSGTIVLSDEQTVYIERDKIINDIHATPGDAVKVGDVLIEYDTTQEQLKLNSMMAELAEQLKLNSMMAELAVTETNLKLANNQLVKLQNITSIPDDSEIPKTPAELALEAAEEELTNASASVNEIQFKIDAIKPVNDDYYKDYIDAVNAYDLVNYKRYIAKKELYEFQGKEMDEEEPTEVATEQSTEGSEEEIVTEATTEELSDESKEAVLSFRYNDLEKACKDAEKAKNEAQDNYNETNDEYQKLLKQMDDAKAVETEAQKKYDEASEAQQKEYEEQLENPTPVYTESELKRAIRLKNEEIKDLKLSIDNQNLAIKRQQKEEIKDLKLSIDNQNLAIKRQQKEISKGTVVAELDGIIQSVDISEESIAGGSPAIVISAEGAYSARVSVDEFSLDEMEIGEEVSILSYDTGSTYYGKVSKKSEAPSNDGYSYYEYTASSYPVTIVIEGGEDLSEGMWVEVTRNSDVSWGEKSNEIVLPLAFCKKEKGSYYVMKREGDRLKKQYISTGKIYWGQYIVVKSGLKPDDFIAFPYAKDAVEGKVCKEADISDLYGY